MRCWGDGDRRGWRDEKTSSSRTADAHRWIVGIHGFRFPPEVIMLAVRWYLRCGLSYRDLEELLSERGVDVDHVTLFG